MIGARRWQWRGGGGRGGAFVLDAVERASLFHVVACPCGNSAECCVQEAPQSVLWRVWRDERRVLMLEEERIEGVGAESVECCVFAERWESAREGD